MFTAAIVGTKPPFPRVANLVKLADEVKVVAVCDLREEWAKECASQFGIEHAYSDFHAMLELPFDILVSYTGTYSRPDQVVAAAEAGRHIFTEKPLALSIGEGKRMVDAVRAAGVKYQIGYQLRTHYFARAMKQLVDEGVLGEISSCMSRRFMPAESCMILLSFLSPRLRSRRTFSIWAGAGRLPNSPRLWLTVAHTVSKASVVSSCGTSPMRERVSR